MARKNASKQRKKGTTSAVEILHRRFVGDDPKKFVELQQARTSAYVAGQIYDLRTKVGFTQKRLADLVGTTPSVISRLEDDDYDGHSLSMLHRVAAALGQIVEVRFVPAGKKRAASTR